MDDPKLRVQDSHDRPAADDVEKRTRTKRRPKTIAAMMLAAFLAFAPPGTLIAGLALTLALVRYCSGAGEKDEHTPQTQATPSPIPSPTPLAGPLK